ncbi:hypothetical protein [Paraburkholderia sp. J8-2]|uniref:hypothetical protein n=1 Tax=Paraburkholderia sp. J8-2 TaxID=2805440 RepID=UPI002AB60452|nr:hypothetical protein [Paraburkholderia sp. J8-2]
MERITESMAAPIAMSRVARDGMLFNKARDIWVDHAMLELASDKLSLHFGSSLPGRNGPLLQACLVDAISAYRSAEGEGARAAFVAYLVALLRRATDVFDLSVQAEVVDGIVCWDPLAQSLSEFVAANGGVDVSVSRREKRAALEEIPDESMLLLAARLMPESVGRFLVRHVAGQR